MIGISTLSVLWMLQNPLQQEVPYDNILGILQNHLIPGISRCSKENDIVNGAAGFLYALLLIEKQMEITVEEIVD
jgi:lantibiotic modifying enzyme